MTSPFRSTNRTLGATTSPEKIRREWQDFQTWLAEVRNEEEAKRLKEYEELRRTTEWRIKSQGSHSDTITTIQADLEKENYALRDRLEDRVASRAKQEWAARLRRADLKMEQWT